jgi:hypothetical protein
MPAIYDVWQAILFYNGGGPMDTKNSIISLFNEASDKGNLTSRQNGAIGGRLGGQMTKKLHVCCD